MKTSLAAFILCGSVLVRAAGFGPVVEIEEDVYTYTDANNGAGPMWCFGSTSTRGCGCYPSHDPKFASPLVMDALIIEPERVDGEKAIPADLLGFLLVTHHPQPTVPGGDDARVAGTEHAIPVLINSSRSCTRNATLPKSAGVEPLRLRA